MNTPKFDYAVLEIGGMEARFLEEKLQSMGDAGWELVCVDGRKHIFKRIRTTELKVNI